VTRLPSGKRVVYRIDSVVTRAGGRHIALYFPLEALALTNRRVGEFLRDHQAQ
jgi:hypothetical protein